MQCTLNRSFFLSLSHSLYGNDHLPSKEWIMEKKYKAVVDGDGFRDIPSWAYAEGRISVLHRVLKFAISKVS